MVRTIGRKIGSTSVILIIFLSMFSTISIVTTFAPVVSAGSTGDIPINDTDWNVTQNTYIEDSTFTVRNITVRTGITLTLNRTTIIIKSTSAYDAKFQVNTTSTFNFFNSSILSYDSYHWIGEMDAQHDGEWQGGYIHIDNSTISGVAGHHITPEDGFMIEFPQEGSYIKNLNMTGYIHALGWDYFGRNILVDGITFWGTQYCIKFFNVNDGGVYNVSNIQLLRGYASGVDAGIKVYNYGAVTNHMNFINLRGYAYTGAMNLFNNRTVDLYTPFIPNIYSTVASSNSIVEECDVYAYDNDFNKLTDAKLVVTNNTGEVYNESIDGYKQLKIIVGNGTPNDVTREYFFPFNFTIYNDTYSYTRSINETEWKWDTWFNGEKITINSNNLSIVRNKFPYNYNWAWTHGNDAEASEPEYLDPLLRYLDSIGIHITVTLWVYDADSTDPSFSGGSNHPGLANHSRVEDWALEMEALGHTIGIHTASSTNDTRPRYIQAMEDFFTIFGHYPDVNFDHSDNIDNWQLVGSEGRDSGSIYYNWDYVAPRLFADRGGALRAGYTQDTMQNPWLGTGNHWYITTLAPNSTELYMGTESGEGFVYNPNFDNDTCNNYTNRIITYSYHASGLDASYQYTGKWGWVEDNRSVFIGSGHMASCSINGSMSTSYVNVTSGNGYNDSTDPSNPWFSGWDPNSTYAMNQTAIPYFMEIATLNAYTPPVETLIRYMASLDGVDWREDFVHDMMYRDEMKMVGGVEILNEGNRIVVENRNDRVVEGPGIILGQNITLVNGDTYLYPNNEYEINFGNLSARSRTIFNITTEQLNITTDCYVSYYSENSTGIYLNLTNIKNGTVTIQMPIDWTYSTSMITIYDATDDEIIGWVEGSIQFNGIGGHDYRIYLGEDVSDPPRSPGVGGDWNGIIAMVISIMAIGLIVVVMKNGLIAPMSRIGRRSRS